MGFRNDEESRRARVDALLAERGAQDERIGALEERLESLEARLLDQETRLEAVVSNPVAAKEKKPRKPGPSPKPQAEQPTDNTEQLQRAWRAVFVVGGLAVLGLGFGMFATMQSSQPPTVIQAPPAPAPTLPTPTIAVPPVDIDEDGREALPHPQQPPQHIPPEDPRRLLFTGEVSETEGAANVEVGATCEVRTDLVDPMVYLIPPDGLVVQCGTETLYSVGTRAPCTVQGQAEDFGGLFVFDCEDRGIRPDRPEMELRSAERTLRVWSETHGWSVSVTLERAAARVALRRGLNRRSSLPFPAGTSLTLQVQASMGEGAPSNDTALTLSVQPNSSPVVDNCDLVVRAGRRVVGESRGICILDSQLNLSGIDAAVSDRRHFGVVMERDADTVTLDGVDGERSWHVQAVVEPD